jgi:hypothetical protein
MPLTEQGRNLLFLVVACGPALSTSSDRAGLKGPLAWTTIPRPNKHVEIVNSS